MPYLLLFAAGVLYALSANAVDSDVSGWLRFDIFSSTRSLDDRQGDGVVEAGFKYTHDSSATTGVRFEGKVFSEYRHNDTTGRVVDGYWQHRGDSVDWRIGQQKISWGKTDGLNPTDLFTAHDYTVLQPLEQDQRFSVPAVRLDYAYDDNHSLSFIVSPNFTADRLPQPDELHISERKPSGWRRPQLGARWLFTGDELDWSISAFRGYMTTPLLGYDLSGLFHYYPELEAVGADVAHNFGRWGFRAEAAWLRPSTSPELPGGKSQVYLVAGVDHGDDDWNINLQLVAHHTPDWCAEAATSPMDALIEQQNAINTGQLNRNQYGMTSRLAASWIHQTLQAELLLIHYLHPGNSYLRPLLTYAYSDSDKLRFGGEYFDGPDSSFFGQLKKNRTLYVEYQHYF